MKLYWKKLTRAEAVVVDETMLSTIRQCLPSLALFVVPVRGEWLSVHPGTVARWFFEFMRTGRPRHSYWQAVFKQLNPTVCLSGSDHNPWILSLADEFPEAEWIILQNAFRFPDPAPQTALGRDVNYQVEFWSFGQWELDCYELENVTFKRPRPAGSIRNSLWCQLHPRSQTPKEFDVCLLSQFRSSLVGNYVMQEFEDCARALREWMDSHPDKNVVIAGVAVDDAEIERERKFFESVLPQAKLFSSRRYNEWQSYELADRSQVSVTSNSTAGIESLARGNRVLLTGSVVGVAMPSLVDTFWGASQRGSEGFSYALDKLLEISDEEFWDEVGTSEINYVMEGSPGPSTVVDLQTRVLNLVDRPNEFNEPVTKPPVS